MPSELKPCPFCGEAKDLRLVTDADYPEIECLNCFAVSPFLGDGGWDWNTRPAEDAKDKEIERLKKALEKIYRISFSYVPYEVVKIELIKTVVYGAVHKNANAPDTNVGTKGEQQ